MLIAGTYNLLDRSAGDELLPACLERGGGGNQRPCPSDPASSRLDLPLAHVSTTLRRPPLLSKRVSVLQRLCDDAGAELGALAVQFGATHPAIASVCLGARTVEQQECNLRWLATDIPDYLWAAVADL